MDFLPSDLIFQQQQPNNHENTHHHLHFPPQFHSLKRPVSCEHEEVNTVFNGGEDELSDDGYSQIVGGGGEKKRRLNVEQVRALERSFELGNKLEPERKLELAKALGLQPRQIAIWFQNRRARWKTKQLEKDYDLLKKQFDAVKADNDALQSHNQKLHAQLEALKNGEPTGAAPVNPKREAEDCWSYGTEGNSDAIDMSRAAAATNGMISPHQFSEKPLFPTTSLRPSITQLLHGSSEATADTIRCPKGMDQMAQDDSLICNMLGGVEDRPGFWPWHEQHHFH